MASERRRNMGSAIEEARQELAEARAEASEMAAATQALKARVEELEAQLAEQNRGLAGMDLDQIDEPLLVLDQELKESIGREGFLARRVAEMEARRAGEGQRGVRRRG